MGKVIEAARRFVNAKHSRWIELSSDSNSESGFPSIEEMFPQYQAKPGEVYRTYADTSDTYSEKIRIPYPWEPQIY